MSIRGTIAGIHTDRFVSKISVPLFVCLLTLFNSLQVFAQTEYGNNPGAGKYYRINGVNLYVEIYGKGRPLLLIHGNVTGMKGWAPQIRHFEKKYQVIAMDCRGRGKSELGSDSLTYLQMAADAAALIRELKLDSVFVVGKSDGGIVALLMGIYFPERLAKIVAFGANLTPDSTALLPETVKDAHHARVDAEQKLKAHDTTDNWEVVRQRNRMMEFQPHITAADLERITLPVLVMSTDRDLIKEEHTLYIYQHIRNANLCILNGEVHSVAKRNPDVFNEAVDRYLSRPFAGREQRFKL